MATNDTTNWSFNSDIYDITDTVTDIKKRYIEDENEDTLNFGIFGFIGDTEAKKIQTSVVMAGQLGNELFPARAKLTKNVIAHAIYNNITDINAVPARLTVNMGIKVSDLDEYMESNRFVIDCKCPIFVSEYEFHFDYDIIINRVLNIYGEYAYSAHYDLSVPNYVSDIKEAYLKQPFIIKIGNYNYLVFQAQMRQYTIEETSDRITTDSIIENKSYTFSFDNQLADFDVYVTSNGTTTRLRPYLYGSDYGEEELYCWYLYISDNTVRINFDSASYVPGLNADILIRAYTTLGESGNFIYKNVDESDAGFYADLKSDKYGYDNMTLFMVAVTNSVEGTDRKSKGELQKLIPKMAHARGNITTDQDVRNYFNLIDSDKNRLVIKKKVDNNISRVWYAYFILKDEINNVIPANTIKIHLDVNDGSMVLGEDGRYILPAGTVMALNKNTDYAVVIDAADVPAIYTDEFYNSDYYYYITLYNVLINKDPLYAAYYLTISDLDHYFEFKWVNELSMLQFVTNKCNFKRQLLTDQSLYKFEFKMAQSIPNDYGLYVETEDPETGEITITNKHAVVLVLYKDGAPHRWLECNLAGYDKVNFVSMWTAAMPTDNGFDTDNNIKIVEKIDGVNYLHEAGSLTNYNYAYLEPNIKAVVYIMAEFDQVYGRYDLDAIAPGFKPTYTVTNIYNINEGLKFYTNFTNVLNTRINPLKDSQRQILEGQYEIIGFPVGGVHFLSTEESVVYFTNALNEKKDYIDDCLALLENNMDVDFKFFNTYGPSKTYTIGDKAETPIGHVDLEFNFRVSIKSATDIYTKDDLISYIKNYIENIDDIGDLHIPNMITDITNEFSDRINYIEFMNFNDFWLGVQHIEERKNLDLDAVPEFLNIRNKYNESGRLVPAVNLEVTY